MDSTIPTYIACRDWAFLCYEAKYTVFGGDGAPPVRYGGGDFRIAFSRKGFQSCCWVLCIYSGTSKSGPP